MRKGDSKMDDKYFTGICMMCHTSVVEVRHIDIYVVGSEGLYICKRCEKDVLLPFIRETMRKNMLLKKERFKERKQ